MKTLVTGANGHIGSHVVRACLDAGQETAALVRPGSDRRALSGLEVELREGDLLDIASLERAMHGIDVVHHVGAVHRNWVDDDDKMMGPAVRGTQGVLDSAKRACVRRVVVTSSGATVGFAADPAQPLDESATNPTAQSLYTELPAPAKQFSP